MMSVGMGHMSREKGQLSRELGSDILVVDIVGGRVSQSVACLYLHEET